MMYKIVLDDGRFMFVDKTYSMSLYDDKFQNVKVPVSEYSSKYKNCYFCELPSYRKASFTIEACSDRDVPKNMWLKKSQDIKVGDLLLGPNNQPRTVDALHSGHEKMYEITVNGKSYVVNENHVLALVDTDTNERLDIKVNVYMHMNDEFKSHFVMESEIKE